MAARFDTPDNTAILNLSSLLRHDQVTDGEVEASGSFVPISDWHSDEVSFKVPLEHELTVRNAGGDDDFILTGQVSGTAIMPCRRCLEPVEVPSTSDFVFPLEYRPGVEGLEITPVEEDEELLVFGHPEVDFAQMMTEIFDADLPLTVACADETKCVPLAERYAERETARTSPFSLLENFDVNSKE